MRRPATGTTTNPHRLFVALVIAVVSWWAIPRLLQTLLGTKSAGDVQSQGDGFIPLAAHAQRALLLVLIALGLFIIATRWRTSPSERGSAVMAALLPWAYIAARTLYLGQRFDHVVYVYPIVVLAVWMCWPAMQDLSVLGYCVVAVALVSLLIAAVLPHQGFLQSSTGDLVVVDKQILPGGSLVGILSNGNNLGQFLALGLPLVWLIPSPTRRRLGVGVTGLALVWSASRTCIIAAAVAIVVVFVLRRTRADVRGLLALLAVVALFALVCVVPLVVHRPSAFANRGYIWQQSLIGWHTDEIFGRGTRWFQQIAASSGSLGGSVFHAHNQFLQLLVTGGWLYALSVVPLLFVATVAAARAAGREDFAPVGYLCALAVTCVFEVSLTIADNDLLFPVSILPLVALAVGRPAATTGPTAPPPEGYGAMKRSEPSLRSIIGAGGR